MDAAEAGAGGIGELQDASPSNPLQGGPGRIGGSPAWQAVPTFAASRARSPRTLLPAREVSADAARPREAKRVHAASAMARSFARTSAAGGDRRPPFSRPTAHGRHVQPPHQVECWNAMGSASAIAQRAPRSAVISAPRNGCGPHRVPSAGSAAAAAWTCRPTLDHPNLPRRIASETRHRHPRAEAARHPSISSLATVSVPRRNAAGDDPPMTPHDREVAARLTGRRRRQLHATLWRRCHGHPRVLLAAPLPCRR